MSKFKTFLYTIFLFTLIAFSVSFISIHADAKILQGDGLHGAFTPENFLKQGDAEIVVKGVSNYVNAGATPTTCAGGVPSGGLTVDREKSKAMSGDFYWKIVKSAGDQQGEGIAFDFTVDGFTSTEQVQQELYAKAKVIAGSFLFGTKDVSSDIGFYLYDVTASKLVTLGGGNDILGSEVQRWFTPTKDSTQYRLCAHVQTTAASAYTLGLDDLFAGKAAPIPVGDVNNTFTAQISDTGVVTRQEPEDWIQSCTGQNIKICTLIPNKFSEALNCTVTSAPGGGGAGVKIAYNVGSTPGVVSYSTAEGSVGTALSASISCTRTGSDYIKGAEFADQWTGQDVYFEGGKTTDQTMTTPEVTKMTFTTRKISGGAWSGDSFTALSKGVYTISASVNTSDSPGNRSLVIFKNGGSAGISLSFLGGPGRLAGTASIYLEKGDVIDIRSSNASWVVSGSLYNYITIAKTNSSQSLFRPQPPHCKGSVSEEECATGDYDFTVTPAKPIFKRCYVAPSNITSNSTLVTWESGLQPVGINGYSTVSTQWMVDSVFRSNTVYTLVIYNSSNGQLTVDLSGTDMGVKAGAKICMEYVKP